MSSSEERSTSPVFPKDSDRGSSVSSDLQDEYEELLRYAVVTPKFEPSVLRQSDHVDVRLKTPGKSPVMDERRQRTVATGQRKPGRSSDFATSTRTTRIEVSVKEPARQGMEGLCPVRPEETSEESSSSQREIQESNMTELSLSDERVTQIESILDLWSGSLKTNVLTELRKWKLHFIEHHRLEMSQEREKHAAHVRQLTNQLENLKELLHTYEMSIGRKDEVIASLTHAIEKQKDRLELMRRFTKWRLQHFMGKQESRHEVYADRLANRLYEIGLLKKAWGVWRSTSHRNWKETMEKACQSSAECVRVELSNDYEAKIQELNAALEEARNKVLEMQNKRQDYEDAMKKAFMRGVCALNLEAMTIFQGKEIKLDHVFDLSDKKAEPGAGAPAPKLPPSQFDRPLLPPPSSSPPPPPPPAPPPASVPAENLPLTRVVTSAQQKSGRTITARITGRSDFGPKNRYGNSLAVFGVSPPMNSVVVEKHHPVTQQTISQATAAKYPRTLHHFPSTASTRPPGHSGKTPPQPHSIIQSIKVVD
ncbi:PREDICTED: centrosomal protein POC5 isoform X2 [Gekko japonicus]|uniref:Centrosomal protein POC5 n=1 Tax=Gekko japonicus TaxID=146911 RepID=A0ABM1KQA5_GEKJA|nr:PREDICTED: centrosomal protein POC5 isoform X2 [Gekko japonicus]